MEKSDYNGKYVLPLTMSEVVTHHLYSKDPRKVRDMIVGQHSQGLNKLLQTGEMINTMLKEVFTDVNLYDDHIRLMQYPFPSPIGRTAISFYHFYIQDTVQVGGWGATVAITSVSIPLTSRTSVSLATFTS